MDHKKWLGNDHKKSMDTQWIKINRWQIHSRKMKIKANEKWPCIKSVYQNTYHI